MKKLSLVLLAVVAFGPTAFAEQIKCVSPGGSAWFSYDRGMDNFRVTYDGVTLSSLSPSNSFNPKAFDQIRELGNATGEGGEALLIQVRLDQAHNLVFKAQGTNGKLTGFVANRVSRKVQPLVCVAQGG